MFSFPSKEGNRFILSCRDFMEFPSRKFNNFVNFGTKQFSTIKRGMASLEIIF